MLVNSVAVSTGGLQLCLPVPSGGGAETDVVHMLGSLERKKTEASLQRGFSSQLSFHFAGLSRISSCFFFFAFFLLISYLSAHELTMFCTWSWWCHRSLLQLIPAHVRRMKAANTPAQVASLLQGTSQNMRWRL